MNLNNQVYNPNPKSCCYIIAINCLFQIYVEIERARLTKHLAMIKEEAGELKDAAAILQELQVNVNDI